MYTIIISILVVIMIASILHWVNFSTKEGKDERGKMILGRSSQIAFSIVVLAFGVTLIGDRYITFSTDEQFTTTLIALMTSIMLINSISIAYFRKKY
ncbi:MULTISPECIES: hypothetical protein [Lysinibacillus]|uniref:DUF2178 domain-containing protein n=1 Tax=Lysinibacillus antri TaxID=2498145 RepID=A0A432LA29_9BACI|nr:MULTISPECIES: hypothetical protein [Lysinibacillus]RUL50505.1 hypothetical protein EK386_14050 [Lysinibacillus antri]TSI07703.1 hypothetical protein FJQ64_08395 [Lysinibacillus sp. BW-2-10]